MVYQGTVQNGVVVFANGTHLPEGTSVRVELAGETETRKPRPPEDDVLLNMSKFAVDMGIPDLAVNIDHYLYRHPKVADGQ
jgi:hypothetical protein